MSERGVVRTADDSDGGTTENGGISRRGALAATGGLTASVSTAGCMRRLRSIVNRDDIDQLSLTITTQSSDGDRESIRLAREIAAVLEAVGIDVAIDMRSSEEFLRSVLINHDFDVYVGPHPGGLDPDFLYEALHSLYADESGWQNPFGFTNLLLDELLEEQRETDGEARREAVEQTLEALAIEQPFVPICRPTEHRLVREDHYDGWEEGHLATRSGYLGLEAATDDRAELLRTGHTDAHPSQNLNPLSAEYRDRETFVELLYDSLAAELVTEAGDRTLEPWLAADWEWEGADGEAETLVVDLREDCEFHDGEPVTADDVEFTYRFLADTSLGESTTPAPAPLYRGRATAIDDVEVRDAGTVAFAVDAGREVAERGLTVPILPEHVWETRSAAASVPGVRVAQGTTEAVVTDNVPPVGSGPFRFGDHAERDYVTLERFDRHFTHREDVDLPAPTVGAVRFQIEPRSSSALQSVAEDGADLTSMPLEKYVVDDVEPEDGTRLLESPSWTFYHLGFNARKAPFGNPRFRQVVARLIDKAWLVEDVFHGHAEPIATPVTEEWTPDDLAWDDGDPETPFLGSDGEVDVEAARTAFEEAGFRYDSNGKLRVRHY